MEKLISTSRNDGRYLPLDFLRGVAIILVLGSHASTFQPNAGRLSCLPFLWRTFGWTGVDLFFVLSGFLIGGLLFRELSRTSALNVRRFILRRGFKIWPMYYIFLLVAIFGNMVALHRMNIIAVGEALWPCFLHIQNYHMASMDTSFVSVRHLWSLGVEEHFYLLLPLLLLFFTRRKLNAKESLRNFPWIAGAIMLACLGMRCTLWSKPFYYDSVQYPTQLRIDSLICGVLLAYAWEFYPTKLIPILQHRTILFVMGMLLISPMTLLYINVPFVFTFGFTMLYLGYGCILLACMASTKFPGHTANFFQSSFARSIAWIGQFSYPIYLFHLFPSFLIANRLATTHYARILPISIFWLLYTSVFLISAIAVGIFLSYSVERPMLALRNRLLPA